MKKLALFAILILTALSFTSASVSAVKLNHAKRLPSRCVKLQYSGKVLCVFGHR